MKPAEAVEIDTGERGMQYLRKELGFGGLLSKSLLRSALDSGRVVTRAFSAADLPTNFDWGLDPTISKLQWQFAAETIVAFLRQSQDSVAVFQHPFATPHDKWLAIKPVPYVSCENDVLFVINTSWAQPDKVELALVSAGAQQELGILARHEELSRISSGTIAPSVIGELVARCEGIVVRAFDAEGYLLWSPSQSSNHDST
jgi:hypothetical protein